MSTATTARAAVCAALRSADLAHHASAVEAMPLDSADLRALGAALRAANAATRARRPWHGDTPGEIARLDALWRAAIAAEDACEALLEGLSAASAARSMAVEIARCAPSWVEHYTIRRDMYAHRATAAFAKAEQARA